MQCQHVIIGGLCLLQGLRSGLVHLDKWIMGCEKGSGCRGYYTVSARAKG